jgi:hypothetical protein
VVLPTGGSGSSGGCATSSYPGSVCAARITTNNGVALAGVVVEQKEGTGSEVTTHNLFRAGATSIAFPLVKNQYFSMSTGLRIQNVGSAATTATVTYYRQDGSIQCSEPPRTLAVGAATTFFVSPCTGTNFLGSVVVTASQPLVGMANETNVDGSGNPIPPIKKAYASAQGGRPTAYGPWLYRTTNDTWLSGIAIQNLSSSQVSLTLTFYDTAGNVVHSSTPSLAARGSSAYLAPGPTFTGSVVVANQNIAAVVNVANNSTSGDGHAIYNASSR